MGGELCSGGWGSRVGREGGKGGKEGGRGGKCVSEGLAGRYPSRSRVDPPRRLLLTP